MAQTPRVVAELGRPETPDETADRKAESSRVYRSSQNTRNLIAALLATLVVVAVIVFGVPRGAPPAAEAIDVVGIAAGIEDARDRAVLVPTVPEEWIVNGASVEGDSPAVWTVIYVPGENEGFLRLAQAFDADETWPTRVLGGADVGATVTIGGIQWQRYDIADPERAGNITTAVSTTAGADTVLLYGTTEQEELDRVAASLSDQIAALREDAS